ncbi:MAG: type II toxin-antitoxin system HicB family antitoxin [Acidobacteria bacterium]|nr:type II toxin-antitoxin system HicB family antitoxin [Acidobacteriota bacterium]
MKQIIHVHIFKREKYYVAECHEFPVVTQGKSLDELAANLQKALALHLEGEDLSEYDLVQQPSVRASFEIELLTHAKA